MGFLRSSQNQIRQTHSLCPVACPVRAFNINSRCSSLLVSTLLVFTSSPFPQVEHHVSCSQPQAPTRPPLSSFKLQAVPFAGFTTICHDPSTDHDAGGGRAQFLMSLVPDDAHQRHTRTQMPITQSHRHSVTSTHTQVFHSPHLSTHPRHLLHHQPDHFFPSSSYSPTAR